MLVYCNINVIKQIPIVVNQISLDQIKIKKAKINPINKIYKKCFQDAVTVALNHEVIKNDWQRITKIRSFIDK